MDGLKKLSNIGISYIGDEEVLEEEKKTLIVVGIARGGTSLIAGALDCLGVFTGEESAGPVYEDKKLAKAFESDDIESVIEIVSKYNIHDLWAYKRPSSINHLREIDEMFRNPIYLIVFKDIFSIANRNKISMKSDIVHGLNRAHDDYAKVLSFISANNLNAFLFSYEKVMTNKDKFVDTLIRIIGKNNVSDEQEEVAKKFIEPNSKAYLDASRITKSIGRIGSIEKKRIIGWAKYLYSNKPATVDLYINNEFISSKVAKDFRQNVLDLGQHPTGNCGYYFDLEDDQLHDGDIVTVKVQDDVLFLNGSNKKFVEKK